MTASRTHIVSVHFLRRTARERERQIQRELNYHHRFPDLPDWAHGVRVEKAGPFQWAVVLTETRGH